ncbi:MAG: hypothetical protein K2L78_06625 [Muribaculaceae bacterium]|nr:hypothetical protein [Muribaculaceae bacterium]
MAVATATAIKILNVVLPVFNNKCQTFLYARMGTLYYIKTHQRRDLLLIAICDCAEWAARQGGMRYFLINRGRGMDKWIKSCNFASLKTT